MDSRIDSADKSKSTTRVALSVHPEMLEWVGKMSGLMLYGATAPTITSLLGVFRDLLRIELRRLPLTVAEASCIADVLNGGNIISPPMLGPVVYAELSDAFSYATGISSYGLKWGVDEDDLRERILGLGPTGDLALRIAIADWWSQDGNPDGEGFRAVGLNITTIPGAADNDSQQRKPK